MVCDKNLANMTPTSRHRFYLNLSNIDIQDESVC